jgi:hypothetical protein
MWRSLACRNDQPRAHERDCGLCGGDQRAELTETKSANGRPAPMDQGRSLAVSCRRVKSENLCRLSHADEGTRAQLASER